MTFKKTFAAALVAASFATVPALVSAQVAGATVIGVTQEISAAVADGWSVKRSILGENVYSSEAADSEAVGDIEDIIIDREGAVTYAVVNASRYLGLSSHYVLVPVEQFTVQGDRIVLPGSTKDALRELPPFEYTR